MAAQISLNTLQPENVAFGADILIQAKGAAGTFVTLAETTALDVTADNDIQDVPVLGSRITGARPGRFKVSGTLKNYYVNEANFSEWMGSSTVVAAGSASIIYGSQITFARYNIYVSLASTALTAVAASAFRKMLLVNVVFSKQMSTWDKEKLTEESIDFVAEDILYNPA